MRVRPILLAGGLLALGGCASILGWEDFVAGKAAIDETPPLQPGQEEAEADLYVSPTGDDANDGARGRPLRSPLKAVLVAQATDRPRRIAICEGKYTIEGALSITGAITLSGGWDCRYWRRPLADDARVGRAADATPTVLIGDARQEAMISLNPNPVAAEAGVTGLPAPRLERLSVEGTDFASVIAAVGPVVLTDLDVTSHGFKSPATLTSAPVAIGITLGDCAEPARVEHCNVSMKADASGPGTFLASGIALRKSNHRLRRNALFLDGIPGACIGVSVQTESAATLAENNVQMLRCIASADQIAETGLLVEDSAVESRRNGFLLDFPGHTTPTAAHVVYGIYGRGNVPGLAKIDSDGDRIVGPTRLTSPTGTLAFVGITDGAAALARVTNASIVLASDPVYKLEPSAGIFVNKPTKALIAHNSMYFGISDPTASVRAISVRSGSGSELTVESNLLVTDQPAFGVVGTTCPGSGITVLANNRFAGFLDPVTGAAGCASLADVPLPPPPASNVRVGCSEGKCRELFSSISDAFATGLRLAPAACSAGVDVPRSVDVGTDAAERARADSTTAGAFACE